MEQIKPHGGTLVDRMADVKTKDEILSMAGSLERITLTAREISDLEMIAVGAFSPLTGFMGKDDYDGVLDNQRLSNGSVWTIPVTLSVTKEKAKKLSVGKRALLVNGDDEILAAIDISDNFPIDRQKEALEVYGTDSEEHPGVAYLHTMNDILIGGEITLVKRTVYDDFKEERLDPAQTRALFKTKGWKRVVGFQTRNPIHRAHEYIQKCALEICDALLLHPLVGATKKGDIPADVRMDCYKAILDNYFPKDRTALVVLPAAMRYAGPKEAIFHAIIRKNYGCTHFIVGRDHAGVGGYYGSFDAHYIFDDFSYGEIGITPLFFDYTFFCKKCGQMSSYKTCPHGGDDHISLSGTKVRGMLMDGKTPPPECSRPEVAKILIESYKKKSDYHI
jgi:sulfate adenylyltransferase